MYISGYAQSLDTVIVNMTDFNEVVALRPALAKDCHIAPRNIDGYNLVFDIAKLPHHMETDVPI